MSSDAGRARLGLRLDGYNFQIPAQAGAPASIPAAEHQRLYEPHFDSRTRRIAAIRFASASGTRSRCRCRSLLGADVSRTPYAAFAEIPSYDNSTGQAGAILRTAGQSCSAANYADQLYWLTRDYRFGSSTLEAPLVGATFTNIDLSWAHEFHDGSAMKITPFYRRGYNVIEQTAQIIGFNYQTGSPVYGDVAYSNMGIQKATGIEALYTKEFRSGSRCRSARPTSASSATSRPARSYSPLRWRSARPTGRPIFRRSSSTPPFNYKTPHGWRINPVIDSNVGYPYGAGYYTAVYCNGIPVIVPNTSLGMIYSHTPGYIDPLDPGTCTKPNIAATRGIARTGFARRLATPRRGSMQILRSSTVRRRAHRTVGLRHADRQPVQSTLQRAGLQRLLRYRRSRQAFQRNGTVHVLHRTVRAARYCGALQLARI